MATVVNKATAYLNMQLHCHFLPIPYFRPQPQSHPNSFLRHFYSPKLHQLFNLGAAQDHNFAVA